MKKYLRELAFPGPHAFLVHRRNGRNARAENKTLFLEAVYSIFIQ